MFNEQDEQSLEQELSNEQVQSCINNLKGRVTLQEYNTIIDAVFDKLNISEEDDKHIIFDEYAKNLPEHEFNNNYLQITSEAQKEYDDWFNKF